MPNCLNFNIINGNIVVYLVLFKIKSYLSFFHCILFVMFVMLILTKIFFKLNSSRANSSPLMPFKVIKISNEQGQPIPIKAAKFVNANKICLAYGKQSAFHVVVSFLVV